MSRIGRCEWARLPSQNAQTFSHRFSAFPSLISQPPPAPTPSRHIRNAVTPPLIRPQRAPSIVNMSVLSAIFKRAAIAVAGIAIVRTYLSHSAGYIANEAPVPTAVPRPTAPVTEPTLPIALLLVSFCVGAFLGSIIMFAYSVSAMYLMLLCENPTISNAHFLAFMDVVYAGPATALRVYMNGLFVRPIKACAVRNATAFVRVCRNFSAHLRSLWPAKGRFAPPIKACKVRDVSTFVNACRILWINLPSLWAEACELANRPGLKTEQQSATKSEKKSELGDGLQALPNTLLAPDKKLSESFIVVGQHAEGDLSLQKSGKGLGGKESEN
ncbi:hypothetical protein BAUCODRAFT_28650 [Baudoinia panamericana UAMH 10762]|uniref:Uncharacterized protein n=1 Tax=Baudoinia panamericana (strain UAMH 10762) TaxID=717646 RepID=M2M3B4_BAUPA|nr:uncharacterized protein BAUCODRAFT_28650 [Baudoinia panamericana UAMH 10762]EMC91001.1 hypothetical protein BAUCODRAFT_28650 [Baudoinia panamericana UAMH 10762]